ncbi:MAG: hypothetical protein MPW14_19520 [Candidatus Manganitrophus sp.]|nr:MAG: hypothetical protein MPW14_19520 [Candidatus Manganitrophus sp.]
MDNAGRRRSRRSISPSTIRPTPPPPFIPAPFPDAAVLCMDGVGEWATTSVWLGEGHTLASRNGEIDFPHSLGLLYSAFTYYTGFKVNSGEYKVMGLAPYGEPAYVELILEQLFDLKDDGTFRLNMDYFHYSTGLTMTNAKFNALFGGPPRAPEEKFTQREMDLAGSIQAVTEEVVLRLARTIHRELGVDALCLAGGVALNCVANGKASAGRPDAGDLDSAGGRRRRRRARRGPRLPAPISGTASDRDAGPIGWPARIWGPGSAHSEIKRYLDSVGAVYEYLRRRAVDGIGRGDSRSRNRPSGGFRAGWNSDRARSAPAPFSAIRAVKKCNRS